MGRIVGKKKFKMFLNIGLLSVPAILAVGSLAWFKDTSKVDIGMNSIIHGQYFQSGDGSSDHPFEIARGNQLYYLSWLQQMGYFNILQDDTMSQFYFYLSSDLDMAGYTLPPIGTQEYPFIGNFDGRGHTISNLTVYNTNFTDTPVDDVTGVEIVGFFGVIGTLDNPSQVDGTYVDSDYKVYAHTDSGLSATKYTYNNSIVSVRDFKIKNCTIQTQTNNALIGIAAGYVNGEMDEVRIVNSNISVKEGTNSLTDFTRNISDYSVVGYCRDQYVSEKTLDPVERPGIEVPAGTEDVLIEDAGNAWGGSLDMHTMFNNLYDIKNNKATELNNTNNPRVITSEDVVVDEISGLTTIEQHTSGLNSIKTTESGGFLQGNLTHRVYDQSDLGQFYYFNNNSAGDTTGNTYLFLYGSNDLEQGKTINTVTKKNDFNNDAFYIVSDGHYMTLNVERDGITDSNNEESASKWMLDSSNHLYTQIYDQKYYVNFSMSDIDVSNTGTSTFSKNGSQLLITLGTGTYQKNFGLCYDNIWKFKPNSDFFYITDGDGNYLSVNSENRIVNKTSVTNATYWFSSNAANQTGVVYTYVGNTLVYLRNNSGLQISTTTTTNWTKNANGALTNNGNSISFNGGSWSLSNTSQSFYYIRFRDSYLGTDGSALNTEKIGWTLNRESNNTSVSSIVNGTTYYLSTERSGNFLNYTYTLVISTTEYTWDNSNPNRLSKSLSNGLIGNTTRYVTYNNGWIINNTAADLTFEAIVVKENRTTLVPNQNPSVSMVSTTYQYESFETVKQASGFGTYFPLSMDKVGGNYSTNPANTGYVVSGGFTAKGSNEPGRGDIRVSQYGIDSISDSYTANSDDFRKSGDNYRVRTINGSGDHYITPAEVEAFEKFTESKESLIPVLNGQSNVYGLHFMQTAINKNNLIQASQATINNVTYKDEVGGMKYDLPLDSIDFTLGSKGYINFFAGTYYTTGGGNKSFFTLHRVFRDDSGFKITDIKEISKVYKPTNASDDYIYQYSDGTYSEPGFVENLSTNPVVFDTRWIKTQSSLTNNAVYYFEVPVNAGEFALGSDPSSNGAYLLYLDLSANKQTAKRTITGTTSIITTDTVRTPSGVQIVKEDDDSEFDPFNSATYQLGLGYSNATADGDNVLTGSTNYNRTHDGTLGKDRIDVTIGGSADENVLPTFVGNYTENEIVTSIFSNPPGFDQQGDEIPYLPYKREYVSNYSLNYADNNEGTGTKSRTVVSCVDRIVSYANGTKDISRVITFDVYLTPKGSDEETLILSMYSDSVSDSDRINFTYSFSQFSNTYYFSIQYNDNVNTISTLGMHITALNPSGTNYTFMIANTGDSLITGSPTAETPINIQIAETETSFDSLFKLASEYEPIE